MIKVRGKTHTMLLSGKTGRVLISLAAVLWLSACSSPPPESPEALVKKTLQELEEAAEARSLQAFMKHISPDYQDHRGDSWEDIQRLVQFQYIRNQNIHIYSNVTSLTIEGDMATAEVNVAMAARAADLQSQTSRLRADTHRFSVLLTPSESGDQWLVSSVSWQRGWQ
jgi:hypothetical protein